MHNKHYKFKKVKTIYNLERRKYFFSQYLVLPVFYLVFFRTSISNYF